MSLVYVVEIWFAVSGRRKFSDQELDKSTSGDTVFISEIFVVQIRSV